MIRNALPILVLALAPCAAISPIVADDAPNLAVPAPPDLRLPRTFLPDAYAVHLVVDPAEGAFHGHIDIDAQLARATRVIWLNGQDLTITAASLTTAAGERVSLESLPAEKSFVAFRAADDIPAGKVTLSIAYGGVVDATNTTGLFHQKDGETWYAITNFEPLDARRAFPCFDEPDVKVPWQLTLEIPADSVAVSNTPVVSETRGEGGGRVVTFARTKPLPSYLIAFAVGPFDVVDAGKSRGGAPVRVIAPRGRAAEAKWAVASTLPLLTLLEDYFGTPYPYDKLDMVAVPVGFGGAMENAGMITYGQSILLRKEADSTIGFRRSYASIAAHEMAHQWFGDLVTMAWWDDTWLNESFATWMAGKIITSWKPEWDGAVDAVDEKSYAMDSDSLKTARKIHQPIESENDIKNSFDNGITYAKGASVIRTFERWVGPADFQKGIRKYLADHAWKNATAVDFLNAIGDASRKDVVTPFTTFLDQVGAPIVSVGLTCARGQEPVLTLAQQRYVPLASKADARQTWQIPICVKYANARSEARACTLMTTPTASLPLAGVKTCPSWVLPNEGETGYYRMHPEGELLDRLLARGMTKLSLPERVGVVEDVGALVGSGQLPPSAALALAATLGKDGNRHLVGAAAEIAKQPDEIIGPGPRANYQRFVRTVFGARAKALGWAPKKGEDEDTKILRSAVVGLVARQGEDKELVAEATRLAWAWLDDHGALDPEMVWPVLAVAARNGDRKLYDRLYADAKKASDISDRRKLLGPMGGFVDREISRVAMDLTLTDEFDAREAMWAILGGALEDPRTRPLAYQFVKANYDAIVAKLPRDWGAVLVYFGSAQCDAGLRDEVADFFKDRNDKLPGGPLVFTQQMESMDLCIAHREAFRPSMEAFLRKY